MLLNKTGRYCIVLTRSVGYIFSKYILCVDVQDWLFFEEVGFSAKVKLC